MAPPPYPPPYPPPGMGPPPQYYGPAPYPPPYMYPPPMMMMPYNPVAVEAKKAADLGLVCGILAFFFFGIVLGPVAIYFGMKAHRLDPSKGYGGIVLGAIATILYAVYFAFILSVIFLIGGV